MDITLQEIAQKLREYPSYRIYYHKSPDGDAVMSAYVLALALQSIGIPCEPKCCDLVPEVYRDLIDPIKCAHLENYTTIAVDSASAARLGKYSNEPITFCIDHHENNMQAEYRYVVPEASSCAELIYRLLLEMEMPITPQIANLLYVGLVTDTQCFRTYSTNQASLETAAELAKHGADIVGIARRYALEKTPERIAIEQVLLNSFHYTCNGRVLGCMFTYDDMKRTGADDSQLEGLNLIVDQVRGPLIGIVVRETLPGYCRVSVRTYKNGLSSAEICATFRGGGHADRAGCEIKAAPEDALAQVEIASAAFLQEMVNS